MNTEILAPAGNIDSLKTAVKYGADAVYFGLSDFNARMKADNFSFDNLGEWVDFCHLHDVKVYITLNTIIKNDELNKLYEFIYKAATCNVDAFIVTDLCTVDACKKICPDIPLHFSTQFGVHNLEGAREAKRLGASRVILSRETPLAEIKRIIKGVDIEVEAFVHGAMCVSFSGNCYLSSFIDGNSRNRGRCKQPCRLKFYSSILDKDCYCLSMKDMSLFDKARELADAGVKSLKIEGRLKSPEYVASSVVAYKKVLTGSETKRDFDNVRSAYARVSTSSAYLDGVKSEIISPDVQNNVGLMIGNTVKSESLKNGLNKISFSSNRALSKGDGIKILLNGREICGAELSSAVKENGLYVIYTSKNAPVGSSVSLTYNSKLLDELQARVIEVNWVFVEEKEGEYKLTLSDGCRSVEKILLGDYGLSERGDISEGIKKVLSKNSTPFTVNDIYIDVHSQRFLPHSVVNNLRKEALDQLALDRINAYKKSNVNGLDLCVDFDPKESRGEVAVIVSSVDELTDNVLSMSDIVIYAPSDYARIKIEAISERLLNKSKLFIGFPLISFEKDIKVLCQTIEKYNTLIDGIYGNNHYAQLVARSYGLKFFAGTGLNIVNNISASKFDNFAYSVELNGEELSKMISSGYCYVFGRHELMSFAHCPNVASSGSCADCKFDRGNAQYSLNGVSYDIDRTKVYDCYFSMRMNEPICLFDELNNIHSNYLIDLRNEENIDYVVDCFKKRQNVSGSHKGYFLKGVL